jgi:hypothetical protein
MRPAHQQGELVMIERKAFLISEYLMDKTCWKERVVRKEIGWSWWALLMIVESVNGLDAAWEARYIVHHVAQPSLRIKGHHSSSDSSCSKD